MKDILNVVICICCTEISQETAVNPVDIVSTLQSLQMLKYWKGKHLVLKRQVSRLLAGLCCVYLLLKYTSKGACN